MTGATASTESADLFTAATSREISANRWDGPDPDKVIFIRARVGWPGGATKDFRGRFAQTLARLLEADGLVIVMHDERHGGPFAGTHGRYELRTPVTVIETREVQA